MSTLAPFVLSILTVILLALRLRRLGFVGALFGALAFFAVGSGWPASMMLDRVQVSERLLEPRWGERNLIVLLGWHIVNWPSGEITTDMHGSSRVLETARLYFDCRRKAPRCRVVVSGGDPLHQGRPEAEAMGEDLEGLGVERADLILEPRSRNTFENARESSALILAERPDHLVLVTSGFHVRRSQLYFAHFLKAPFEAAPSDHLAPSLGFWPGARNFVITELALTEILGIARYFVYNALGRNAPADPR